MDRIWLRRKTRTGLTGPNIKTGTFFPTSANPIAVLKTKFNATTFEHFSKLQHLVITGY